MNPLSFLPAFRLFRGITSTGSRPRAAGPPVQRPSAMAAPAPGTPERALPVKPQAPRGNTVRAVPAPAALPPVEAELPKRDSLKKELSMVVLPGPAKRGPAALMDEYLRPGETEPEPGPGPLAPGPQQDAGPRPSFMAAAGLPPAPLPAPVPDPRMPRLIPMEERRAKEAQYFARRRQLAEEIVQREARLLRAQQGEFKDTDGLIKSKIRRANFKKRGDARLAAEDAALMRHKELSEDAAALGRQARELQEMEEGGLEAWIRGQDSAPAGPPPPDSADYETWLEQRSPEETAGRVLIERERALQRGSRQLGKLEAARALENKLTKTGFFAAFGDAATTAWDKGLVRGEDGKWTTPEMGRTAENAGAIRGLAQGGWNFTQSTAARMGKQSTELDPIISSVQKNFGLSDTDMAEVWSDLQLQKREWEPEEMLRVTSTGEIIPGGTNSGWMDRARAEAAIHGATASEGSKKKMLEMIPQIQQNIMDRKFRGYEMAAGLIQDLSVENPAPILERLEKEGKLSPRTRQALEMLVRSGMLAPGTGGIKTPSRWAEETGRTHYAYDPRALLDYEREVLESNPLARKAWGIAGNVVLGFGDIAAQGAAITGMLGHEGSRKVAGELTEAAGDISGGLDAGAAGSFARMAPQVIAQLLLTKGAGMAATGAGAGARTTAIAGFTTNMMTAGVQSATGAYAQAMAEGDSHERAMAKAGTAGLNSIIIAGVFNLKGSGATAAALGKRKAAELTMRDLTEIAAKQGVGNLARSKELRTMARQILTAYGMEAAETGVETMLQAFATADPDDNLSHVWSDGLRSIAEGAVAGTGIRLIRRGDHGGGNGNGGVIPPAANGAVADGDAGSGDVRALLQRTDASIREYEARVAAEAAAAAAAAGSPEREGPAAEAGGGTPAGPPGVPQDGDGLPKRESSPPAQAPPGRGPGAAAAPPEAPEQKPAGPDPAMLEDINTRLREQDPEAPPVTAEEMAAARELTGRRGPAEGDFSADQDIAAAPGEGGPERQDGGTAAAEAAEGVRIHRTLTAEEGRAAAAMSGAEATKRSASASGDTKAAARAEEALKKARQDYARVPRARAAARIANGAGLDALDPGQKRALGLTPEGFPLDAAGLVEVGLEQPLVSLDEAGRPVLAPAAVEDIARVSPELAARLEATERNPSASGAGAGGPAAGPREAAGAAAGGALLEPEDTAGDSPPAARASGPLGRSGASGISTGGAAALGTPGAPASPALPAGKAVPPLARPVAATPPPPAKGQKVSFRRDGVVVQGKVNHVFDADRLVVQTDNGPELVETRALAPPGDSDEAKEPRPPRPAPLPPVFVGGKLLPTPEWVRENHGNLPAKAYEAGIPGGAPGWAPRLSATDAEGTKTAKFDGIEGDTVIDRKLSITFHPSTIEKALRQSAIAATNGYRIRWEVPNDSERRRAERLFKEWGIKNIEVRIHPKR